MKLKSKLKFNSRPKLSSKLNLSSKFKFNSHLNLTLLGFLRKEFTQALRDPRMKMLLFVAPTIQLTLFGVAISNDVKNIKLWAAPNSNDFVLRHIYERCIESKWFLPVRRDPSSNSSPNSNLNSNFNPNPNPSPNQDPFELLRSGKIDAALIAPPGGLTRALGRGQADLQLLVNAINVIQAQSIEGYMKNIVTRVVQEDLKLVAQNLPAQANQPAQSTVPAQPIVFDTRVLYNPTLETSYFMVPGVMCLLMGIVTIILTSMSIAREKELGTFEMLISGPVTASEVILGKTVPYVILGMSNMPIILGVAVFAFHVPMRGSLLVLTVASFAFVCTAVAIGTLISTFARNQQQSTLAGFLFLFPAILLSGLMFPLENMPKALKWISYLDPLSHFLALLRNIMLKGGEFQFVVDHVGILILMAIVSVSMSFKRFHTTLQ